MAEAQVFSWLRPKKGLYDFGVNKNNVPSEPQVAIQSWLRPALTPVGANADFHRYKQTLDDISSTLRTSGLENQAIDMALEGFPSADPAARSRRAGFAVESLRVEIVRHIHGLSSFRKASAMVCASDLLSDFCGLRDLEGVKRSSRSTLERRSKIFSEEQLRRLLATLTEVCGNSDLAGSVGLPEAVPMDVCLVDGTCLEANIHFPVDWVLLKDVSTTLLKALKLMREEGVKARMPEQPEAFARQMNRLCMEMTHARRRKDARKRRKSILRRMKKLLRTIGAHAARHREKLLAEHPRTRWSPAQAGRICERIEGKLGQIDTVIRQAHERIIGGRKVDNKDKVLSVHESDAHVIVRGKAGKEVEFGNTLFISENAGGYITDWRLYPEQAPAEGEQLAESLRRQEEYDLDDPVRAVCADRGFSSKKVSKLLEEKDIYDATCPRAPADMAGRMGEQEFASLQRRRGGTESRIATLRNIWLGGRVRAKGHTHRALAVGWGVLAHNLWFVARKLAQSRKAMAEAA